jgi:PAS domain-containing protein
MATLAAVTNMPALALLGEEGRLEQSTEPFRRWYKDREELCKQSPELQRVVEGQANAAVLKLDGISVDIAAVSDRGGGRHVLLTLPTDELPSLGDAGGALLDGALDESPAIVWLKDLDGRYVRVNSRFTTSLGTTEDRLLGRTDAELPPAETVDGPRLQEHGDDIEEPLQLEYVVGPYQGRDALVVLRFPVGDANGVPTLVCGVAAPSSQANVARGEAARLLRIERWSRLDAESVRAEMLAEWGVLPDARGRSAPATIAEPGSGTPDREQQAAVAEARAERATAVAERDAALSASEALAAELGAAKARLTELERTLALVRERLGDDAEAARTEVGRARADADAARTEVERARADAEAARAELEKARAEAQEAWAAVAAERESASVTAAALEQIQARVQELESEVESFRAKADEAGATIAELGTPDAFSDAPPAQRGPGVSWQPTAKRTLAASLARESVWRNVLKETVQVLGAEGGWDTVTAWLRDESDGLGCAAMWTAHRGLDRFEALTWEASPKRNGSLLDQALQAPHVTWLTDIDAVDDERLQTAAAHGISSALLLPVRNGASTIGLLELLTRDSIEPDAQIALSLEASALQLGRFGHLLSLDK